MVSVIVPVRNETQILTKLDELLESVPINYELIVVDTTSNQRIPKVPPKGLLYFHNPYLTSRAQAMNFGAKQSKKPYLWFLHVDCSPSPDVLHAIEDATQNRITAAAFQKTYHPTNFLLSVQSSLLNRLISKKKWFLVGTNSLLIQKDYFLSLNGFRSVELFEDVLLFDFLRKHLDFHVYPQKIKVSSRNYQPGVMGSFRILKNILIYSAFRFGVSPKRLALWYR